MAGLPPHRAEQPLPRGHTHSLAATCRGLTVECMSQTERASSQISPTAAPIYTPTNRLRGRLCQQAHQCCMLSGGRTVANTISFCVSLIMAEAEHVLYVCGWHSWLDFSWVACLFP